MSLVGAASGASQALEDIVAQRILAQKLQAEITSRQQQMQMEQDRAREASTQNAWERGRAEKLDAEHAAAATAKADQSATEQRGRSNMAGVLSMGLDPETTKREVAFSSLNSGAEVPKGVMEAMTPARDPLKDYEEREKIKAKYAKPAPAPKPGAHVVGGSLVDDSGKVLFTDPTKAKPAESSSHYEQDQSDSVVRKINDLIGDPNDPNSKSRINWKTAGVVGTGLASLPIQTEARDVHAELQSLAANLAFEQLQKMRAASKTGGALGAVSDTEIGLLKNAEASIRQDQSPANLTRQLGLIRDSATRFNQEAAKYGGGTGIAPAASHGGAAPMQKPIPGIQGGVAESLDGGKTWKRVK